MSEKVKFDRQYLDLRRMVVLGYMDPLDLKIWISLYGDRVTCETFGKEWEKQIAANAESDLRRELIGVGFRESIGNECDE